MGHILFGLPEIGHFHLHSRVARKLTSREHRVSVLAADPVVFEFFSYQGLASHRLRPAGLRPPHLVPLAEFATLDCRLAGIRAPSPGQIRRATRRLERWVPGLIRLFEHDRPDLLLLFDGRSGLHRLLHFVAVQYGAKVMHLGPGLLPMTLQVDPEGVDGDASFARATAQSYRRASLDEEFLAAAAGAWLGRACPPPLAWLGVAAPPLGRQILAAVQTLVQERGRRGWNGVGAWRQAQTLPWPQPAIRIEFPRAPFVCLLLQDPDDPRLRLDAGTQVPDHQRIHSTWQAVQRIDPEIQLVVVEPGETGTSRTNRDDWPHTVHFVPPSAAALAVSLAMAVVTANHPLALAAILAGTPVLHTEPAPYGIPGVATRTDGTRLAEHLAVAVAGTDHPTLQRRFLTRILQDHHIWCPPQAPDSNGVAGIVNWIEEALSDCGSRTPLGYRPGPVWPLATTATRRQPRRD